VTTKTKQRDPATELEQLQSAADKAKAEATDLANRHDLAVAVVDELRAERVRLQFDAPAEWTDTGPRPGSNSERVNTALLDANESLALADFAGQRQAAEERARLAHDAVTRYRAQNARQLLEALRPQAQAAVEDLRAWVNEGSGVLGAVIQVGHEAAHICHDSGIADPRSVPNNERLARLVGDLSESAIQTPLPRIEDA
jgi:hypothetical protein